jgi:hypothetical protein
MVLDDGLHVVQYGARSCAEPRGIPEEQIEGWIIKKGDKKQAIRI